MRIKSIRYGKVHGYAICNCCDWSDGINTKEYNRMQKLRERIYKHIRKTGHTVILETGDSTQYEPER